VADDKNVKTLLDWTSDMAALEAHIEAALDRQLGEVKDDPQAVQLVQQFHDMVKTQRDAIQAHVESLGGKSTGVIKEVGSTVLGMAAGIIDKLRAEGISKSLRDDYTAFNLAAMGYEMLHTTAHALGHTGTMQLAERHLRGYARAVQQINHLMPDIVLKELAKDGHTITDTNIAQHCRDTFDRIWKETAQEATAVPMPAPTYTASAATTEMPG
jgi:ferritin-like metal-binding protein YciE